MDNRHASDATTCFHPRRSQASRSNMFNPRFRAKSSYFMNDEEMSNPLRKWLLLSANTKLLRTSSGCMTTPDNVRRRASSPRGGVDFRPATTPRAHHRTTMAASIEQNGRFAIARSVRVQIRRLDKIPQQRCSSRNASASHFIASTPLRVYYPIAGHGRGDTSVEKGFAQSALAAASCQHAPHPAVVTAKVSCLEMNGAPCRAWLFSTE